MLFEIGKTFLYQMDAKGAIRIWMIWQEESEIVIQHGLMHGALQTIREPIYKGKAARSLQQQIESRINSRIHKQELKGYKRTEEEAREGKSNILGLEKPMLAMPIKKVRGVDIKQSWVQTKYDGNRCLIKRQNGKLIAYSRYGKVIHTIDHILRGIDIPEGTTLDGELYHHGTPLNTIRSWVSKKQANTYLLRYHAYDIMTNAMFHDRFVALQDFSLGNMVQIAPTKHFSEIDSIQNQLDEVREDGYEGVILRLDIAGYEDGKRSKSLIKVKAWLDAEFKVVEVTKADKSGYTVLTCVTDTGHRFGVTPPGTHKERLEVYENWEKYYGKYLTCEFANWTSTNKPVPFQPVGIAWRFYDDE